MKTVFNDNIGDFFKYMREYLSNVRETITQRNFVMNEYYRNKIVLNEKKNKKLLQDNKTWDLDSGMAMENGFSLEEAVLNVDIARRLMFKDVIL